MKHIIHFSTVHPRTDVRIRLKELPTLSRFLDAKMGFFVQDGLGDEVDTERGVAIVDTGPRPKGRLTRMTKGAWRMYRALRRAGPDVAHFHDPELIPVGILLRLSGIRVVYDVHEDLPRQILSKPYLSPVLRRSISALAEAVEWLAVKVLSGVIPATKTIAARFPGSKTAIVCNFPSPKELVLLDPDPYDERLAHFVYIGGITKVRGSHEMIAAINLTVNSNTRLQLAGAFQPIGLRQELEALEGWAKVDFLGWIDRQETAALLGRVRAGLVVLNPTRAYLDSLPVKLFEYMAVGLPVIASDFPLWRDIVDGAGCGLLVDPKDPKAIARAMDWILDNPQEAEEMGRRGQRAVEEIYNWPAEAAKLVAFYHDKLGVPLKPTFPK